MTGKDHNDNLFQTSLQCAGKSIKPSFRDNYPLFPRIIELKGDFGRLPIQLPAQSRNPCTTPDKWLSSLCQKTSSNGTSQTPRYWLFCCWTALIVKKFHFISNLDLFLWSFCQLFFFCVLFSSWRKHISIYQEKDTDWPSLSPVSQHHWSNHLQFPHQLQTCGERKGNRAARNY